MMDEQEGFKRHNKLAPLVAAAIVADGQGDASHSLVVLESVIVGVLHCLFKHDRRQAQEQLDAMTASVIERLYP